MMCPVSVANEMSGLKGRVEVMSRPHWRLVVDAVISGPSFGTGNEDQRSHHTGDQWKNGLSKPTRLRVNKSQKSEDSPTLDLFAGFIKVHVLFVGAGQR